MTLVSATLVALDAVRAHKGRTALTSLGIVIGVGAVIALVAAGEGARHKLEERLDTIGRAMILVRAGARTHSATVADLVPLTAADADAIRKQAGVYLAGVAEVQITQRLAITREATAPVIVVGSTPDLRTIRRWEMAGGRFYTDEDVRRRSAVCLLGQTVRKRLFPDTPDPIGQTVRIDRTIFRVIGLTAAKGRSATGEDQDDQVFVPLTTLQHRLVGAERVNLIIVSARSDALIPQA